MKLSNLKNLHKLGLETMGKVPSKVAKSTLINKKGPDGLPQKTLSNFYTGKKLNPKHLLAGGAAYVGAQAATESFNFKTRAPLQLATLNDYQEYGAPDVMSADGVSQQRAPKNMNANGSLVFGLHNGRKG